MVPMIGTTRQKCESSVIFVLLLLLLFCIHRSFHLKVQSMNFLIELYVY